MVNPNGRPFNNSAKGAGILAWETALGWVNGPDQLLVDFDMARFRPEAAARRV